MKTRHLLIEIGTEELPPKALKKLSEEPKVLVDLCHVKSDLIKNSIS